MTIKERYDAAVKALREVTERAKSEGRPLTRSEAAFVDGKLDEAEGLKADLDIAAEQRARFEKLARGLADTAAAIGLVEPVEVFVGLKALAVQGAQQALALGQNGRRLELALTQRQTSVVQARRALGEVGLDRERVESIRASLRGGRA